MIDASREWAEVHHEGAGLRLRYPSELRCLRDLRGIPLTLLSPPGRSDFRSSVVITTEEVLADPNLDTIVRDVVRELDRFLTDYRNRSIEECEVGGRPARRVVGIYKSGRVAVSIEQWLVDGGQRLISITASYDPATEPGYGTVAAELVDSLELTKV